MEGLIDILFILALIGFGVFRQLNKTKTQKTAKKSSPVPLGMEEVFPEIIPSSPPPQPFSSFSSETVQQKIARQKKSPGRTRPKEVKQIVAPEDEASRSNQDFDIHSIEEVRKGIIWSEILTRKY